MVNWHFYDLSDYIIYFVVNLFTLQMCVLFLPQRHLNLSPHSPFLFFGLILASHDV